MIRWLLPLMCAFSMLLASQPMIAYACVFEEATVKTAAAEEAAEQFEELEVEEGVPHSPRHGRRQFSHRDGYLPLRKRLTHSSLNRVDLVRPCPPSEHSYRMGLGAPLLN